MQSTGIGFGGVLFIVFLVLVLLGKISAWWLIIPAFPLLIAFGFFAFIAIVFIIAVIASWGG